MPSDVIKQVAIMLSEGVLVSVVLGLLFRWRGIFGLAPIYIAVAIFYQLANLTAASVYLKMGPDLMMSPGSVVLFPAILVVVLYIYIREDARETRKLIYGLLAGDLVVAALGLLISLHFASPLIENPYNVNPELFLQQPRLLVVGTCTLYLDTVLIIMVYEVTSRWMRGSLFGPVTTSLVTVLLFDTLIFVTGCFVESPDYGSILVSGAIGKTIAGVFYAIPLSIFLRYFDDVAQTAAAAERRTLGDLFDLLTYRQRYEELRTQATRDGLTGVYNRAFFDETAEALIARSNRSRRPTTLLLVDVDFFKEVNDGHGHRAGDAVLRGIAVDIGRACRASDFVCRYGGDEFAVLLPDTDIEHGVQLAERFSHQLPTADGSLAGPPPTLTIGVACAPVEAATVEDLIVLADQRLYEGKAKGRDCVVASSGVIAKEPAPPFPHAPTLPHQGGGS